MTVSSNYAHPVSVNGYSCHNCSEVDLAKRNIDPAHPKDGPFGINARHKTEPDRPKAVLFGGTLAQVGAETGTLAALNTRRLDIRI